MFAQRDSMNITVTMYLIKKKERARMVLTVPEELVRLLISKASLRTQSFTGLRFNAVYNEQRHGKYCKTTTHHFHFLCLRDEGHINLLLSVRSSVRLSVRIQIHDLFGYLLLQFWSYSFNILQDVYTHHGGVHVHRILIFFKYSQNDRQLDLVIFFVLAA